MLGRRNCRRASTGLTKDYFLEPMFTIYQLVGELRSRLDKAEKERNAAYAEKECLAEALRASQEVIAVLLLDSELICLLL